MRLAALCLWATACLDRGPYPQPGTPAAIPTPRIETFSLDCDPDAGSWTLSVTASSWTGGGESLWSQDLQYIEAHNVFAVASAPEPTAEELLLVLDIASDWRLQAAGKSTVFTCADDPNVGFTLLDVEDNAADCRFAGPLAEALAAGTDCEVWTP